ncbi:CLUMA_CG001517, isoform A [Clunio marinus]|uniref:CLUMA_CG001517, isoform A n=1 Tax=Clunio marinus TaxID=568069 RepID=A0A1J1HI62_9DIPT|nr:CLUMA_CG001517, isoform A [Clunio marinus]
MNKYVHHPLLSELFTRAEGVRFSLPVQRPINCSAVLPIFGSSLCFTHDFRMPSPPALADCGQPVKEMRFVKMVNFIREENAKYNEETNWICLSKAHFISSE